MVNITGVATQGERKEKKNWVYTYNLNFSSDGQVWWTASKDSNDAKMVQILIFYQIFVSILIKCTLSPLL